MPDGPLALKDNPTHTSLSPDKPAGLFHQYPPVDLVDKDAHHVPEGCNGHYNCTPDLGNM